MSRRGADLLARTLAAAGVRHVFALSGNHVMPVFDAALDAKLSLIHVRHEAATVHMADAWGRLTGEPGVALVTGGPGHANALGALYTALAAQSPMVLISGHAPQDELGKGAFQEMAQAALAKPLTVASWTAKSANAIGGDVARALQLARKGPVHLSVPNDVLDDLTDARVPKIQSAKIRPKKVDLRKAKRPLVIAGPGAMRLQPEGEVPVIGMESPRGVNDPSLGKLAEVLAKADVVLLLGKPLDFTLKFGKAFAKGCRILRAEAPVQVTANQHAWFEEVRAALAYRPDEWRKLDQSLHPVVVCRAVQKLLDAPDAVFVSDGGEFGQWAQACLRAPRRVINGPAGSIGSALPFAAAAKLALPKVPVVALLGDGTLGFHLSEIDTAVRYGLDYVAVVGNDACWNAEHQIQLRAYGAARAHGLDLLPTRYGAVAAAMGAHGEDVLKYEDLGGALKRAGSSGKPALVNVMIERVAAPRY
ncbi:MAG TPA: thiamine pyrophosphate-binding protein [Burkholderiales bacterium]|nr:thiamine pyrophosphate-binding protein [Burkholderiales bacterium]